MDENNKEELGGVDPTQEEDNFDVGQGDGGNTGDGAPTGEPLAGEDTGAPAEGDAPSTTAPAEDDKPAGESIGDRLSGEEAKKGEDEGAGQADTPLPFDISKLSLDQLQTLKARLSATPDTQRKKKENPKIRLRRIEGNLVIDFKNAFLGLVKDAELNREVERHLIPVLFEGQKEFQSVLYSKFINSEQVFCEVVSQREVVDNVVEGETISRETGLPVEMVRKEVKNFYTVKLPDSDETMEIEGRLANA